MSPVGIETPISVESGFGHITLNPAGWLEGGKIEAAQGGLICRTIINRK